MLPDQAGLYLVALDYSTRYDEHIHFWENVYGVNMSCIQREVFDEPLIEIVDPEQIMSAPHTLKNSDMGRMHAPDVDLANQPFQLVVQRTGTCHVRGWHCCLGERAWKGMKKDDWKGTGMSPRALSTMHAHPTHPPGLVRVL